MPPILGTSSGALITVDDKEVKEFLQRAAEKCGGDLLPAMKIIGQIVRDSCRENFRVGGRPQKWTPLADSTLLRLIGGKKASRTKSGRTKVGAVRKLADKKTLIDSGRLFRSITYVAGKDIVDIGTGIKSGTDVEYAALHQFGGENAQGAKVPARPYLVVQDEDLEQIKEVLGDYITEE